MPSKQDVFSCPPCTNCVRSRPAGGIRPGSWLGLCSFVFVTSVFLSCLLLSTEVSGASLWEQQCAPEECSCTVEPWPYIQLDAKIVRCVNLTLETVPKNLTSEAEVVILHKNRLGVMHDVYLQDIRYLQSLHFLDLSCNHIRVIHSQRGLTFPLLKYLNLSVNDLHNLQPALFRSFPALEALNVEGNYLSTLASADTFNLARLQYLNLRRNKIYTLGQNFYFSSPQLNTLLLPGNLLSRIPDGVFIHTPKFDVLDLRHNRIYRLEDISLDGIKEIGEFHLEGNSLKAVPAAALRLVPSINQLFLDRNLIKKLTSASFRGVNATYISLTYMEELTVVLDGAFSDMPYLQFVNISHCRALTSISVAAFAGVPRLREIDVRSNNLFVLEEQFKPDDADHLILHLGGNPLLCDCNVRWIHDIMNKRHLKNITIADAGAAKCYDRMKDAALSILDVEEIPGECPPFILPLFHPIVKESLAGNVSFLCRGVGIPRPEVRWILPDGRPLVDGVCEDRTCVTGTTLIVKYLHVQDSGVYECRAENSVGTFKRTLHLEVDKLNILMFPLSITSTFVTLTWNASNVAPAEYVLQYKSSSTTPSTTTNSRSDTEDDEPEEESQHMATIEIGTKVHSYTINGLSPGHTYVIQLGIKRESYTIQVSSITVTTKEDGFMVSLAIRRSYLGMGMVGVLISFTVLSCVCACGSRLWRWRQRIRRRGELVLSPSSSTRCFVSKSNSTTSDMAAMTYVNAADDSMLVDNEDESPQ